MTPSTPSPIPPKDAMEAALEIACPLEHGGDRGCTSPTCAGVGLCLACVSAALDAFASARVAEVEKRCTELKEQIKAQEYFLSGAQFKDDRDGKWYAVQDAGLGIRAESAEARVKELEQMLRDSDLVCEEYRKENDAIYEKERIEIASLTSQVSALREALEEYGQHTDDCAIEAFCAYEPKRGHKYRLKDGSYEWTQEPKYCTCGLDAALSPAPGRGGGE